MNKDAGAHLICMCFYGEITLILFLFAKRVSLQAGPNANMVWKSTVQSGEMGLFFIDHRFSSSDLCHLASRVGTF
jgi:hypothetical protein